MNQRIKELYLKTTQNSWAYDSELKVVEKFTNLLVNDMCQWVEGVPETEEGMMLLSKSFIIANIKAYYGVNNEPTN